MSIKDYTIEELEKEIKRKKKLQVPKANQNPNFSELIRMCENEMKYVFKNGFHTKDFNEYLMEEVFGVIFGKNIFGLLNDEIYR